MADPNNEEIKKVQIADVADTEESPELDDSQLDKVSGGGYYGPGGGDYS